MNSRGIPKEEIRREPLFPGYDILKHLEYSIKNYQTSILSLYLYIRTPQQNKQHQRII